MTTLYWGLEYAKVLVCYLFILFIWPSAVFRKYLHGKSRIFQFGFCAVVPVVLYTTVVLGLGLLHLLNAWVVNILFYGTFLFSVRKSIWPDAARRKELRRLVTGSLKLRTYLAGHLSDFRFRLRRMCKKMWQEARPHAIEYGLLVAVLIFGLIYFSWRPFQIYSYGFGDMNVHHSWVYGLVQGQIFSEGIYPEGMHCVLYLMHTVSGIDIYSGVLFLGPVNCLVLLLSVYCLGREVFHSRVTSILVLAAFVILPGISMDRLGQTLPMEYGMPAQFLCTLFLLRFLKENLKEGRQKNWRDWLRNDNLLLFCMSLAATLEIHYYATILAFFMCLPVALFYVKRAISKTRLIPLIAAVLFALIIVVLPTGLARLSGISFHGSMNWALSLIQGDREEDNNAQESIEPAEQENASVSTSFSLSGVYKYGYCTLYNDAKGTGLAFLSVLLIVLWVIFRLSCMLRHAASQAEAYDGYIPIIAGVFFLMVLYAAPKINIPELIRVSRIGSTEHLMALMVVAMPLDILFSLFQPLCADLLIQAAAVVCVAAIYVGSVATGNFHGYLYSELFRYSSVVDVTNSIIQSFPQNTYTIVSSTDDLYQIYAYGRHEEWLQFLREADQAKGNYLPTEYVFIYVEKRPIVHAQLHFADGPSWLASHRKGKSVFPHVLATEISDTDAEKEIPNFSRFYDAYQDLEARTIINSKMYKWCQDFAALYDHEMKIYYEDEDFVCYYFRQNPYSLYNLAIWG